ncbi:MAG: hypothetical protein GVY26_03485 [Bacteroidetes bacterium]|jgi:hypothetical protein|nr:hypothetical protein [Bacteroidota bacterium]
MMDTLLTNFLQELQQDGTAVVHASTDAFSDAEKQRAKALLAEWEETERLRWPGEVPALDEEAALWAATYVFRAAQFFVHRDFEEQQLRKSLRPYPGQLGAAEVYSADLCLRHLPRLHQKAKALAPADVLVELLEETARQFPLSSVGMDAEGPWALEVILAHPSLRLMYTDRIIEHKDQSRLEDTAIREAVYAALGAHAEAFWPAIRN